MKIAIDLDNTITADKNSVEFFRILTHLLIPENDIYIITNRNESDREDTEQELSILGIRYNKLIITDKKAEFIREQGITIYFENEDRFFLELGEEVVVFKIRESGNFDFSPKKQRWIGDRKTTKMIDEED